MTMTEFLTAVEKELDNRKFWFEGLDVRVLRDGVYGLRIYDIRGDWKHDHLYLNHVVTNDFRDLFANIGYLAVSCGEEVTESDGSDYYTADHEYKFTLKEDFV